MTNWKKVFGTQAEKPQELDTTSSPATVYQRRNIVATTRTDEQKNKVEGFEYEECELTLEEYQRMQSEAESPATQAIMQAISDMQLTLAEIQLGV